LKRLIASLKPQTYTDKDRNYLETTAYPYT